MNPDHPWMWWPWGGMWIFPIVMFVIMLIFFFLFLGRWGCRPPWWGPGEPHRENRDSETGLEILKKRYAKGEITKGEFDQMKKDILS
jgi:putative membrane protein